ncbi:hypothetical protein C8R45DRAFT_943404 [Mycena sanguinolenta]|nr:hypothetical protein C8R45DRAFT_948471 [Mycena sanguinolenta]KAJ6456929.1 hypothetical protein C8R45DRAFT_943404 [Mycena sanguinolenta]
MGGFPSKTGDNVLLASNAPDLWIHQRCGFHVAARNPLYSVGSGRDVSRHIQLSNRRYGRPWIIREWVNAVESPPAGPCVPEYGQCGGQGFVGPTCCVSNTTYYIEIVSVPRTVTRLHEYIRSAKAALVQVQNCNTSGEECRIRTRK